MRSHGAGGRAARLQERARARGGRSLCLAAAVRARALGGGGAVIAAIRVRCVRGGLRRACRGMLM